MNVMINGNLRRVNLACPTDGPSIYELSRLMEKCKLAQTRTNLADTTIDDIEVYI